MEEYRIDPTIAYDIVELPSKGVPYASKKKSVRVSYLTAADENILASINLVNSGTLIDELLKRKILDRNDLPAEEIVEEDRQAILIFLRNTAWGSEYTFNLVDPKTKEPFKYVVDLSTVKIKEFNLVPDSNDEFPYFMEKSGAQITFKYLNRKQETDIKKLEEAWNGAGPAPIVTKQLETMIKSVNGIRELMQIHDFIEKMPIKDSQDFKKYYTQNKYGLELTQKVKTPSGEIVNVLIDFGVEFFRPFYGL